TGVNIVKVAVEAPLKQIAVNAGREGGGVAENVKGLPVGQGLSAATGAYEDPVAAGIIDPAQITHGEQPNAAASAGLGLTTAAGVADKREPAPAGGGDDMGGMGGMGGMM